MIVDEMTTEPAAASDAAAPVAAPAPEAPAAEAAPKKRATRRTKKADDASAEQPAEEAPKKRRGRPRKADAEAGADGAAAAEAKPAGDAGDSADEKPKRATRARSKAKTAEGDEAEAEAKPKRGRKPKKSEAAQADADAPAEAGAGDSAEAPKPRKRPGRSTKLRAAVEASEAEAGEVASSAAEGEAGQSDGEGVSAQHRRPGRPRKSVQVDASADNADHDDASDSEGGQKGRYQKRDRDQRDKRDGYDKKRDRDQRGDRNRDQRDRKNNQRNDRQNRNDRHNRRDRNNRRDQYTPKTNIEDLSCLKVAELREKAAELEVDITAGMKKAELVDAVYEASVRAEGFIEVEGILDIMQDGYGFLRTKGYLPSEHDVYIGTSTIRRNNLRKGDMVRGQTRPARENEKYAALQTVISVNGIAPEAQGRRVKFGDLTPVFPDEPLIMEHGRSTITARVIDLVSPIGKGQRGLIVSPPKAGKTTVLKNIAAAITANNPDVHLMCLLVDERPEEVTDMQRSIDGEVIASTFDMPTEDHIQVSELVIERAKRLVEMGQDVVILLDSLTRLARAYNLATPASGRILSGGVDSTALYPPKRFLGAARNIEGGGSLTILASALIETGSKMDEVIFEEFKGTGNMELKLDRSLADRRIFPAIDPVSSGTRREDLLLDPQSAPLIWAVRSILANMNNTERAMDMLIKSLKQTDNNAEFLMRTAKKAQGNAGSRDATLM